jgi:hypothetical protein
MSEPQIACPKCGTKIRLTDTIAAPLLAKTRKQFEQQLAQKEAGFARQQAELRKARDTLVKTRQAVDDEVAKRLQRERTAIARAEAKKARLLLASDLAERDRKLSDLQRHLQTNAAKLAQAQQAEAQLLRKSRELDDARREVELSVEKRVHAALATVRDRTRIEIEDTFKTKVSEKETQIASMQRQIEQLRRKAGQGSQQLQGEAFELQIETLLRQQFPQDVLVPNQVGASGGDILQRVRNEAGEVVGTMLWECKQTRTWNNRWLAKLRNDQRGSKADVALIVSSTLPKGIDTFGLVGSIWVSAPRFAIPLAIALRQSLIEIASSRQLATGRRSKMEMMYRYLTGPQFRQHIGAIIETFADMQADLDRERRTTTRLWAKREAQLNAVIAASAGFYGDLQGIAGQSIPDIESLSPLLVEDKTSISALEQSNGTTG